MECGSQDAFCQLTNWFTQNDLLAPWLVEVLGRFGVHANGIIGAVAQVARDYGQAIVGLIGVSFGIWRWWRYREHILHKRLAEYRKATLGDNWGRSTAVSQPTGRDAPALTQPRAT